MAKAPKKVTIPMPEFIHEHTKLVDVLTKGTPAQRKKEAKDQTKELKTMTGGVRDTPQGNLRNVAVVLDVLDMDREESFPISKKAFKAVIEANAEIQQRLKDSGELHALSEEWREVQDAQSSKDTDRYKKALAILREAVIAKAEEHETKGAKLKRGGTAALIDPTTQVGDALAQAVANLIGFEINRRFPDEYVQGQAKKTYNGSQWYLERHAEKQDPITGRWTNYNDPPGLWYRTDLTPDIVDSLNIKWEVLGEFPDGTLKFYRAGPIGDVGYDSVYVDEEAREELWAAWNQWEEDLRAQKAIEAYPEVFRKAREAAIPSLIVEINGFPHLSLPALRAPFAPTKMNMDLWLKQPPNIQKEFDEWANMLIPYTRALREWRKTKMAAAGLPASMLDSDADRYVQTWGPKTAGEVPTTEQVTSTKAPSQNITGLGKPPEERRLFPEQFSKPVRKLMDELSFGPPDVMGSSGDHRVMYAADYDLLEMVTFHGKASVKAFQRKIATLVSKVCVTDIKVGEVSEWNLLQDETYSREKELAHLRRLWQEKVITDVEKQEGERMLKESLTLPDRVAARKKLRFGILRWTPKEVAAGVKMTRLDKPVRLEEAMKSKGITKVDVLAWVKDKYVEVSNIVLWTTRGGKPYAHIPDILTALREDIAHYVHDGNYFKVAKRMLSIAKNRKEVAQQEALLAILNSPLGHISTVVSDLKSLEAFPKCVTDEKKRAELDTLRDSMAKLYYPEFFKAKNPTKLLPALERKLQEEARKKLEEAGFLPLKGLYKATKE